MAVSWARAFEGRKTHDPEALRELYSTLSRKSLYSVGTGLGSWLFRDVISGGRCNLILRDVYMLISVLGYNADYFLPNYQRLCLHFCFYFEEHTLPRAYECPPSLKE